MGSIPVAGARKKTVTKVTVFFQRCVPQAERDAHVVRDVSFESDVRLRHLIRNTSHHCERSEQHHYAKHNITLAKPKHHSLYELHFCTMSPKKQTGHMTLENALRSLSFFCQ